MHDVDSIIVGAGVVGLAVAQHLAQQRESVLVLEGNAHFGHETSARHSEVIHAGIYYRKNSLKAKLCVRGKQLLYEHCRTYHIPHKRLEKIIVATSIEQTEQLDSIAIHAANNGVDDLVALDGKQVESLEPNIRSTGGLLSPSTGIIDSHSYMLSLIGIAETHDAMIAYNAPVQRVSASKTGFNVSVGGEEPMNVSCRQLVNAAGHGAIPLARTMKSLSPEYIPEARFAKGNYFRLHGKTPVTRLIYPVPEAGGLGVHITLDLAGKARFGPDVQWLASLDYDVDTSRAAVFYEAVRRYWPSLPNGHLLPDYAGVRPKIAFHNELHDDFVVQGADTHGIDGLVNLFGIESPGLTSSLAIAECVAERL